MQRIKNWSEDDLYDHIATEAFQNGNKEMLEQFLKAANKSSVHQIDKQESFCMTLTYLRDALAIDYRDAA